MSLGSFGSLRGGNGGSNLPDALNVVSIDRQGRLGQRLPSPYLQRYQEESEEEKRKAEA